MRNTIVYAALLAGAIAAAALAIAGTMPRAAGETPAAGRADLAELFDPGVLAGTVCRGRRNDPRVAYAPKPQLAAATAVDSEDPPLWDDLGDHSYRIATNVPRAQAYFDQGLRWAYGFNHREAVRAFRAAQRHDPDCAMCYWGEAWALGPNINADMDASAVSPAYVAVRKAQARAAASSPREQALIAALAQRYSADPEADRAALAKAYAAAMAGVAERFRDDPDIAVLYADALMNTSPWDYWEADKRTPKGPAVKVIPLLERTLAQHPNHPAAIHLYIHIVEASSTPERAEAPADRLGKLMPGAGHLVHMPSHIYYRVGRYIDSVDTNLAAAKADEAYIARTGAAGLYTGGYYPHNVDFVVSSARMAGMRDVALDAAAKLRHLVPDAVAERYAWAQVIKATPYFTHAQMSPAADVLALSDPGDTFPYVQASWHYARAVALAQSGALAAARDESEAIGWMRDHENLDGLIAGGVPAPDLMRLMRRVIAGRIAQAAGDLTAAEAAFRDAVATQDALPYMEPPYWYYPVRQSLGAVLLAQGRNDAAADAFRQSLVNYPNNGWALFGLLQATRAQGDATATGYTEKLLAKAWGGDRTLLDLARL